MYLATKWAVARTVPRFLTTRSPNFFSTTSLSRAAESNKPKPLFTVDSLVVKEFLRSSTFEKLSKSRDALKALQKFAKEIEKHGALQLGPVLRKAELFLVNLSALSEKPLSMIQMTQLLMNSEFRKDVEELAEVLKKTGVDVHSKVGVDISSSMVSGF